MKLNIIRSTLSLLIEDIKSSFHNLYIIFKTVSVIESSIFNYRIINRKDLNLSELQNIKKASLNERIKNQIETILSLFFN